MDNIVQASGKETAWVALRSFTPNSLFDQPRWHTDGYYYKPHKDQYKFVITLKGPSTLFYKIRFDMRERFFDLQKEDNRQALAAMLNVPLYRFQAKVTQGAVYIVGSDDSAVHSEPPLTEERLFLSILPGSKTQIKEWEAN